MPDQPNFQSEPLPGRQPQPEQGQIKAARGLELRCKNWRAEALLRLLENVLEVGERPEDLVVYASIGKAAKDWQAYQQIRQALISLEEDQTLILQTGRPVAIMHTHPAAPRVISAVNNTVGHWATEEKFYERQAQGKTIWGGLTAAAWQYIGRQGVLGGTYELLRAALKTHWDEEEAPHRWLLTAGLGGMGSAQPISAKMLGLSSLTVEANPAKIQKLAAAGGLDLIARDLDQALKALAQAKEERRPLALALEGNAAEVFEAIAAGSFYPDLVTDQTAAHDARYGYLPAGYSLEDWEEKRASNPQQIEQDARASMARQVRALLTLKEGGAVVFENGNNLRVQASYCLTEAESQQAFKQIPGFMEAYLRPLFARGIGPFRWVALSGQEEDQDYLDQLAASLFPQRPEVAHWIDLARKYIPAQGLPARTCWLGYGERAAFALAVNEAVAEGRISGPVALSRDHLDSAGMTHPRIGTEGMKDDSDGVTDWPLLDSMLLASAGADMVVVHSGGGGYSGWMQSAGLTLVADGSAQAAQRLAQSLDLDSGLGVIRHATAGYEEALDEIARSQQADHPGTPLHHIKN
ncbi:MAG: urocanate hydratase [Rothia sp. (in: high G+C Gram-positive bacteria)]|nr:urocanate hydratase [Rothia sp. (in: high G+C Gram-positive bacteria)]